MKKCISIVAILMPALISSCDLTLPGMRSWDIATKNVFITQTIELALDDISGIDSVAMFSDLDQLFDKVTIVENKASVLSQEIDILQNYLVQDLNKAQQITSNMGLLESSFALLDMSGVFTALDALQITIVSAMDLLNNDLADIITQIDIVKASAIDHTQTIASQFDKLDNDVHIVNSLLDTLALQFSLTPFFSLADTFQQDLLVLESNVDLLEDQIVTGFIGTFSLLDQNAVLTQNIVSLAGEVAIMENSDLAGTYSLLDQLNISVQTIDSLTDVVGELFASIESNLDESTSKYVLVESHISLLTQGIPELITKPAFSTVDHDISLLDDSISLLAEIYVAGLLTLSRNIESKLDDIITQQDVQVSDLDVIVAGFSRISTLPSQITAISKLNAVNSIFDDVIDDTFATESYIDPATHIELLFVITDNTLLDGQLNYIGSLVPHISSKMNLVNNLLATTDSTLDIIDVIARSSLDDVETIESILDTIGFVAQPNSNISSTLSVINSQEDVVISKLAVASNLINTENQEVLGLIGDFQATWTILQSLDTKLAQANTNLSIANSSLQSKLTGLVSYSSVFTAIDTIVRNESTINSQVDVYTSMVNALANTINVDFNGVFTALASVNSSLTSSSSRFSNISNELSSIQNALGTPIYTRNLPLVITTPGRYYLAESINYAFTALAAITINTNNVTVDLNGRVLTYTGSGATSGISISGGINNIRIINGYLKGNQASAFGNIITGTPAPTNLIIRNIFFSLGPNITNASARNHKIADCQLWGPQVGIAYGSATNIDITNCEIYNQLSASAFFCIGAGTNFCLENCLVSNPGGVGISSSQATVLHSGATSNWVVKNVRAQGGFSGVNLANAGVNGLTFVDCTFIGMQNNGFALNGTNGVVKNNTVIGSLFGLRDIPNNYFIGFNTLIQNTTANLTLNGAVSVLGNFAFNTNATGSPNNTNYTLATGSIVGKFITISQRTGISGATAPKYWHNINMLP